MLIDTKDGCCRECKAGQLEIVDADEDSLEVECVLCGEAYKVETDAFGDGGVHYHPTFAAFRLQDDQDDDSVNQCGFCRGFALCNDCSTDYVVIHTTAPIEYDGFGTITLDADTGSINGRTLRAVRICKKHREWQTSRYLSGLQESIEPVWYEKWLANGMIKSSAQSQISRLVARKE